MSIWPDGKRAALSIVDDTDDAEFANIKSVYQHLIDAGIRTTKTVWVYPVRDTHLFRGDCLTGSPEYLHFIQNLQELGFEIGLHGVGSGDFTRDEILNGLEIFKELLGEYPKLHVNHSYNKDSIYGGDQRFGFPFNLIVRKLYSSYQGFEGNVPGSDFFWGDAHKKHIKWSRSFEVDDFNTLKCVAFPYTDRQFSEYCNAFYPAVFCPNQDIFARKVTQENVDRLIDENGCSIIYTHFGYYTERGGVDQRFVDAVRILAERQDELWIAPVSEILAHLERTVGTREIGAYAKFRLQFKCLATRIKYRYFVRLDDYHYKRSVGMLHRGDASD